MPEHRSNVLDSTEPTLLTTGWGRTEGPLWHAGGSVTFVDLAGSRLLRWDPHGQVTVVREQTGEGNGCTLDRQGRLLMCEGADHRQMTRRDAAGTVMTLAERWHGTRCNTPHEVVCRSDGSLFSPTWSCVCLRRRGNSAFPGCFVAILRARSIARPTRA